MEVVGNVELDEMRRLELEVVGNENLDETEELEAIEVDDMTEEIEKMFLDVEELKDTELSVMNEEVTTGVAELEIDDRRLVDDNKAFGCKLDERDVEDGKSEDELLEPDDEELSVVRMVVDVRRLTNELDPVVEARREVVVDDDEVDVSRGRKILISMSVGQFQARSAQMSTAGQDTSKIVVAWYPDVETILLT